VVFETWSVTISEELRGIFGLKMEAVTRNWRKLHNEELHKFIPSHLVG
jgi:hypothetical protein